MAVRREDGGGVSKLSRGRPDWWPDEIEWLATCELRGCGTLTAVQVVVGGWARPRCDRHRHRSDRTVAVGPPVAGVAA